MLYHGSKKRNLKVLVPSDGGHDKKYVYAVSCEAFAAIFINRPGGSLVASWGRLKGKPYFCEKKRGVFKRNYEGKQGSIYVVNKKYFSQKKNLWKEEYVSKKKVPVVEEIKINDLGKYMKKLEKEGKFKIIYHRNRLKYFPKIDKELVDSAVKLVEKYGLEKVLPGMKKHQPAIVKEVMRRLK